MELSKIVRSGCRYLSDSKFRFQINRSLGLYNSWDDERYLKRAYLKIMGEPLDLENPTSFNEKLQWLKLHDHNPEYTEMVDKYEVKKYVAEKIGEKYVIPTYGVWDKFDDIDFDSLPDQFVLKCTHDSGGLVICSDKTKLNVDDARKKLDRCMQHNYYLLGREWPYKNVKPRIIAEKYLVDESGYELKDYKVFNFDGVSRAIQVDFDRFSDHKRNLYDLDWNLIDGEIKYRSDPNKIILRPKCFGEMLDISKILSKGIPHVRTDFYCINEQLYFGEMTFYHGSGFEEFRPETLGMEFGSWLKLPVKDKNGRCAK